MTRRCVEGVLACLLAAAITLPALAQPPDRLGGGGEAERRPDGAHALAASAAYPGLGQLWNGAEAKAVVIGASGAFLMARLLLEDRWTRHSLRRYRETGNEDYFDAYSRHFDTRQTIMWWAIVAALYGLADAYVDAHLADFDEPLSASLDPTIGVAGSHDPTEIRLGLAIRF